MVAKANQKPVRYRIQFEFRGDIGKPWRKMADWLYATSQKQAVKLFKAGSPHIWPHLYRRIRATKA